MDMSLSKPWSWWWTGKPGMLQSMGLHRVGHDWGTELNWTETTVEVVKIMAASFKSSRANSAALSIPDPVSGHCWPTLPSDTPEQSWTSLGQSLVGSLLVSPGSTPCPRAEKSQRDSRHWTGGREVLEWLWRDTPHPRANEKPQQDGRRGKLHLESNPISARDAQRAQTHLVLTRTQRPHRDWDRTVGECLLRTYGSPVDCRRGRGAGCSRPGCGMSPLWGGRH